MDKTNLNILIVAIAIIMLGLNYWKIFTISRGIFKVSGILFFKYFFRLLITIIFIYLSFNHLSTSSKDININPTFVYIFQSDKIHSRDYVVNFKKFVVNDLNNADEINSYNLIRYNSKKKEFIKILPDLKSGQLLKIINNNNLQNFNSYPEKWELKVNFNSKLLDNEFRKFEIIENQIFPIQNDSNIFINEIQGNKLNITFNLKVYLLFLLIVVLTSDILLSLKIIKI